MEKVDLGHLLKRLLKLSVIVAVALIKVTAVFLYVLIAAISDTDYSSSGYDSYFGRGWRRRRMWE